jgi:hypothetical protein
MTTTPLDFIASLEHGETKAAALTVYNLMTPKWVEITNDPATLPEIGKTVIVRMDADSGGGEEFGLRFTPYPEAWQYPEAWKWYHSKFVYWNTINLSIGAVSYELGKTPTHWRPIS